MSMMLCEGCGSLVDTDGDPDSLYVHDHPDICYCESCRDRLELQTEFEYDEEKRHDRT